MKGWKPFWFELNLVRNNEFYFRCIQITLSTYRIYRDRNYSKWKRRQNRTRDHKCRAENFSVSNRFTDKTHWGHRGTLASYGVLDRMAGGWRGVLGTSGGVSRQPYLRYQPLERLVQTLVNFIFSTWLFIFTYRFFNIICIMPFACILLMVCFCLYVFKSMA